MRVEKNVAVPMRDGHVLRANVFRPDGKGRFPVLMCLGIYGKDLHFADGHTPQWEILKKLYPQIDSDGTSGKYLRWEVPDPERWVPDGYGLIVVDGRGSGQSPGYLDPLSPTHTGDYFDAIEWAGELSWSNGKVGLLGISYLAITQWQVASLRPPHLAAICPWEGCSDIYREWSHHGGILNNLFPTAWMPRQVLPNQYGNEASPHRDRETGERTTGPAAFSEDMLKGNRADHVADLHAHPLDDEWFKTRSPDLDRITVPLFSAGNWGGIGLHLRGNIEGYLRAGSKQKWLNIHIGTHFESFYMPNYVALQKRFFERFLKDIDNGWEKQPLVQLEIRHPQGMQLRDEQEWPLARTAWTKYFLDTGALSLAPSAPPAENTVSFDAMGDGISLRTAAFASDTEFTGPLAARLHIVSQTKDMDIFATLRLFDAQNKEVIFTGASEMVPVTRGWLRASQRKLDKKRSTPYRPYFAHDESQKLEPGQVIAVDVEIWPTSIVVPKGYSLMLTLQGKDFEFPGVPGRMLHHSEQDRPKAVFDTSYGIVSGPDHPSYLLMPLIPAQATPT